MIYIKLHDTENGIMLAMCDEELIDKIIESDGVYINIKEYSEFYKGELVSTDAAGKIINENEINSANIIGNESVELAIMKCIVEKTHAMSVNGIMYANAYRILDK